MAQMFFPFQIREMSAKAVKSAYVKMRKAANQRLTRMERAGLGTMGSYRFPKVKDLSEDQMRKELAEASRYMRDPRHTIPGERRFMQSELQKLREEYGYDWINESNFYDFVNFMEDPMIAALEDACAWDFIKEMPMGLHSVIGEGGKGLSEGQAQRIAIARALVRKATVMLLDEVTSALDYATEQRVLKQLMKRGITCIVATHRLSVLSMCDHAYRVREGRVELLTGEELENLITFE